MTLPSNRVESSVQCGHRHWISGYESVSVSVVGLSSHYTHGHVGPCEHPREHKRDRHWISVYESLGRCRWLACRAITLHDITLHTHTGVKGVYVCMYVCVYVYLCPSRAQIHPQPCEHPSTAKRDRPEGQFMRRIKPLRAIWHSIYGTQGQCLGGQ